MQGAKKSKLRAGRIMLALGLGALVVSVLLNAGSLRWVLLGVAFVFLASAIVTFMKAAGQPD
jgi:hypothetical protein